MSIKLLPAVNTVDPSPSSDVSTSLVPLTQKAITARAGQIVVPSTSRFTRSPARPRGGTKRFSFASAEDSQSDQTGRPGWGYLSAGWNWSHSVQLMAVAHYLSYAAASASWSGRLVDLYA